MVHLEKAESLASGWWLVTARKSKTIRKNEEAGVRARHAACSCLLTA